MVPGLQAIFNGITMGSIYGLLALGLTLVFGVIKVINFAHGSLISLAMIITFFWITRITSNFILSILATIPIVFFVGYVIQSGLINPVFKKVKEREPISVLLLTAGLSYLLDNLMQIIYGPFFRTVNTSITGLTWKASSLIISVPRFIGMIVSISMFIFIWFLLKYTYFGKSIRAVGQDREAAQLMGISPLRTYAITFALGAILTGIGASILISFYYVHPTVGSNVFGIKTFIIVVLGGLGSIPGALLGGIIVGLIESLATQFFSSIAATLLVFLIFLIILYIKPSGLLGSKLEW